MSAELIDVEMPDGTVISDVPKGTSQSEILRRYKLMSGAPSKPASPAQPTEATLMDMIYRYASPNDQPEPILDKIKRGFTSSPGTVTGRESTGNRWIDIINSLFESPMPAGAAVGLAKQIPSATHAGQVIQQAETAGKGIAGSFPAAEQAAGEIENFAKSGGQLPKVINDFIKAHTNSEPIDLARGRDFAQNAADAAMALKQAGKDNMSRMVTQFTTAMKEGNRELATKIGMGDLYDAAIKEYRQAKTISETVDAIKKWGAWAALTALLGGAATAGVKAVVNAGR